MSGLFKLNGRDVAKGCVLAVIASVGNALVTAFQAGAFPSGSDFTHALVIGVGCGVAYLLKNLLTGEGDKLLSNETK